jgi:hypothetical protein
VEHLFHALPHSTVANGLKELVPARFVNLPKIGRVFGSRANLEKDAEQRIVGIQTLPSPEKNSLTITHGQTEGFQALIYLPDYSNAKAEALSNLVDVRRVLAQAARRGTKNIEERPFRGMRRHCLREFEIISQYQCVRMALSAYQMRTAKPFRFVIRRRKNSRVDAD